jgi:catechol 2,3-dioxygenase-like lactoylglutathione lyase family enzyme
MDCRLELVVVPVTDVDGARAFYTDKVGLTLDHDHRVHDQMRFVQLTPVGSACSMVIGTGITTSPAGTAARQVVVDDADAARADLIARGVEAGQVDEQPWGRFVYFSDPDGNR